MADREDGEWRLRGPEGGLGDLSADTPLVGPAAGGSIVLVRHDGVTAGFIRVVGVPEGSAFRDLLDAVTPAPRVARQVGDAAIAAIVATAGRPEAAARSVGALLASRGLSRVVVVDNRPVGGRPDPVLAALQDLDERVVVVTESVRGISAARNTGVEACTEPYLVFTDDDTVVHPEWAVALAAGLDEGAAVVTGLVLPGRLETETERLFESRGAFGKGTLPRWRGPEHRLLDPLYPLRPGRLGSGNSLACTRAVWAALGGFNESLGVGTRSQGGEDLEFFARVIASGRRSHYTPDAVLWHFHRVDVAALRTQIRAWGRGLVSAAIATAVAEPRMVVTTARHVPRALGHFLRITRGATAPGAASYPRDLVWAERWGALAALRRPGPRRVRPGAPC